MSDAKKLLSDALRLPERERAEMAAQLLASLDESEEPADEEEVDEAWAQEIERRCAALDSGEAVTSDWSEFRARIEHDIFGR